MLSLCCALPTDGPSIAYGIVFLETVQSGLALAYLFYSFSNMDELASESYIIRSIFSPWVGPFLLGSVAAMVVQLFFAYRIWVLSDKKAKWLCLTILFVSLVYFKYCPDAGSQMVSLWIVLRCQSNIRDCWECLCEHLPKLCHVYSQFLSDSQMVSQVDDSAVWVCAMVGTFQRASSITANEDVPSDLASRKRRDRWNYHHFYALSCEPWLLR